MIYRSLFLAFVKKSSEIATNRFAERQSYFNVKLQSNLTQVGISLCLSNLLTTKQQSLWITKLFFCWWWGRVQVCSLFSVPRLRFSTGLCSPEELNVFSLSFFPCLPINCCATIAVVRAVWISELQFPCFAQQLDSRRSQRQAHLMKRPLEWMGDNSKDVVYNIKSKCCSGVSCFQSLFVKSFKQAVFSKKASWHRWWSTKLTIPKDYKALTKNIRR